MPDRAIITPPEHVDYGFAELNAMHECYVAVAGLDHASRLRVVEWLTGRLRSEQGTENTPERHRADEVEVMVRPDPLPPMTGGFRG